MPAKNEKEFAKVRVNKANTRKLKRISRKSHRSVNAEANLAIEEYKPRAFYFDNGK